MSGSQIAKPSVTISIANADQEVQNTPQKVLMVGQKTPAGTAVAGALTANVLDNGDTLFGPNSMLAGMVRAYKAVNRAVQLDVIALNDNGAGVPRVVAFTVVGPATSAGTITVVVASELNHKFVVSIANADTATVIAGNIVAAINADTKIPFTASNVAGAVSLTADNDGTVANDLGVEVGPITATGVSVASVTQTTPGSADPILTGVLDVAMSRYQTIVWPYRVLTVLQSYLTPRFNATNAVLDGVGILTIQDTFANAQAFVNAMNDQNIVVFADEQTTESLYIGPAQNEASYVKSSIFAGIRAIRLTPDQAIGRFLTSGASLDQFGGPAIASLPYFNTPLSDLPLIKAGRGWTRDEIELLLTAGASVMGVNVAGTGALLGDVVTTYKTDSAANPDVTFKFLNFVDTASQAREYFHNNLRDRFAQSRLTEGAVSRGRDMANAVVIRSFLEKLYGDLAGPDFVLVQDGEPAKVFFKDNVTVTLDLALGKATITMLVPIVSQLRTIIATMKIAFSTTS